MSAPNAGSPRTPQLQLPLLPPLPALPATPPPRAPRTVPPPIRLPIRRYPSLYDGPNPHPPGGSPTRRHRRKSKHRSRKHRR